jgi:hypothetical protein
MRDPRPGGTLEHPSAGAVPAPKASHGVSLVATAALLALWGGVTLGAQRLTPTIAAIARSVEVALGLDVLPGPDTGRDDPQEGG